MRCIYKRDFDRWIATELKSGVERRAILDSRLTDRLDELKRDCGLTELQFQKLELAGKNDIDQFLDKVDGIHRKFNDPFLVLTEFPCREADALQLSWLNEFGADSTFSKTFATTLSPEQQALRDRRVAERNRDRYRIATVHATTVLAKALRMNERERVRVEELIQAETVPPRRFGHFPRARSPLDADADIVLFQAAKIAEPKLKAVLGEALFDKVNRRLAHRREKYFETSCFDSGYIPGDGTAAGQPTRSEPKIKNL